MKKHISLLCALFALQGNLLFAPTTPQKSPKKKTTRTIKQTSLDYTKPKKAQKRINNMKRPETGSKNASKITLYKLLKSIRTRLLNNYLSKFPSELTKTTPIKVPQSQNAKIQMFGEFLNQNQIKLLQGIDQKTTQKNYNLYFQAIEAFIAGKHSPQDILVFVSTKLNLTPKNQKSFAKNKKSLVSRLIRKLFPDEAKKLGKEQSEKVVKQLEGIMNSVAESRPDSARQIINNFILNPLQKIAQEADKAWGKKVAQIKAELEAKKQALKLKEEQAELDRLEAKAKEEERQRLEQERLVAKKKERIERQRQAQEEAQRLEEEKIAREKAEKQAQIEQEKKEREEAQRLKQEELAREKAKREAKEKRLAELAEQKAQKEEQARLAKIKAEKAREQERLRLEKIRIQEKQARIKREKQEEEQRKREERANELKRVREQKEEEQRQRQAAEEKAQRDQEELETALKKRREIERQEKAERAKPALKKQEQTSQLNNSKLMQPFAQALAQVAAG